MILITGITGHSGTWFLKKLIQEKQNVIDQSFKVIVRESSNISLLEESGINFEYIYGDLSDKNLLQEAMQGVDTILHIAGIQKSLELVKAAAKNNVKRLILVHTTGIYSKYKGASKEYLEIEDKINNIVKLHEIDLTYLRPTMIYGNPRDNNMIIFIKMVDKLKIFPVVNHAKYELQPVYAKDLGDAYFAVLMNEETTRNKSYNLSGKEPITLLNIFKTIESALGKNRIYISIPFGLAFFGASLIYFFTLKKIDMREKVQRLVEPRVYSHKEATQDFGYSPTSFQEGIQKEISLYLKEEKK